MNEQLVGTSMHQMIGTAWASQIVILLDNLRDKKSESHSFEPYFLTVRLLLLHRRGVYALKHDDKRIPTLRTCDFKA